MKKKIGKIENAFPTFCVLPCGHVCVGMEDPQGVRTEGLRVNFGDCGVCTKCGQWWEYTREGLQPYIPTPAELRIVGL